MIKLPIDASISGILAHLEKTNALVLQASPGSGKTTRVPPALLSASFCRGREVLVLEPRRLAAKLAARRVAEEGGEEVGRTVGYHFRFEKVTSPQTRLTFLTEGMLLRRLLSDPKLPKVGAVVLDEFHERHLHGDVALAYLRALQKTERPDLRIVVMSATIETETVAAYLGGCPIVGIEAPRFPVDISYLSSPPAKRLEDTVRDAVLAAASAPDSGDILVFLPGMGEIRRAQSAIEGSAAGRRLRVHALHGELSKDEQEAALARSEVKKVILSTNVAETSLTIEGVSTVIDTGLHRIASYSWWSGVPALRTRPVSRASAIQRAGRAGRTGPGRCVRLYVKSDFEGRPPFETPELRRADLSQTLLELKALGIHDESAFEWFEAPSTASLESARLLLYRLGALDSAAPSSALTDLGRRLTRIPASPRLARLMLEAEARGVADRAATLAALLSEGEIDRIDAFEAMHRAQAPERVRRQFLSSIEATRSNPSDWRERLAACVLAAFPDRVARRRDPKSRGKVGAVELVFSSGGAALVDDASALGEYEYFVTLEVQEMQGLGQARAKLRVRSLIPIEPEQLFEVEPLGPESFESLAWDAQKGKVIARTQLRYGELVLEETASEPKNPDGTAATLAREGLGIDWERAANWSPSEWIERLAPVVDRERLEGILAKLRLASKPAPNPVDAFRAAFRGKTSLAALRDTDWEEAILSIAEIPRHRLDRLFPAQVELAGGRRVRVHYELERDPWIESRLQDFFGMDRGPSVLEGKLPLTLHLLAPNKRAVQVTTDLTGFWDRTYPALRKELGRKYPRHAWPENPRTIPPKKP